jgi:methylamine--corrinoid protein Co-methyltransferase
MLCVDTSRIIKFTEQELRMVLRDAPSKVILGKGEDLVIAQTRKPEDTLEPTTAYGAMGIKISNDIFIPLLQSIASCRLNDILIHSVPALVYGKEIRSGTPYETLAVKLELFLEREATRRAGNRPAAGRYANHFTSLEQKFAAEVLKSSSGLKREHANEIVKEFIPRYEGRLQQPDKGKSFTECFDLKTLKPTKEWQEIYDRVWNELEDLELPRLY